jgi:hypothetical protein
MDKLAGSKHLFGPFIGDKEENAYQDVKRVLKQVEVR